MSLRQMLAAWIAGKPKDPIARAKTQIVVFDAKERATYKQLIKYRVSRGYPLPTAEEYAAYLRGDAPLASGRMRRGKA
jgi:hypothetical protein